jgi:hypothetical protein
MAETTEETEETEDAVFTTEPLRHGGRTESPSFYPGRNTIT